MARARVTIGNDMVSEVAREVSVRPGQRPSTADGDDELAAFDPREISGSMVARNFAARLASAGVAGGRNARMALDRLAASDFAGAVAAFDAVLRAEPREAAAAFLQGWAYHGAGDDRQAISAWRRAAYLDPSFVPAHLALVDMFTKLSQTPLRFRRFARDSRRFPIRPSCSTAWHVWNAAESGRVLRSPLHVAIAGAALAAMAWAAHKVWRRCHAQRAVDHHRHGARRPHWRLRLYERRDAGARSARA